VHEMSKHACQMCLLCFANKSKCKSKCQEIKKNSEILI
jgi:hypothetical protein